MKKVHISIASGATSLNEKYTVSAYSYVIDFIEQPEQNKKRHTESFYFSTSIRAVLIGIIRALEQLEPSMVSIFINNSEIVSGFYKIHREELPLWNGSNAFLWNKIIDLMNKHTVFCLKKESSMALSDCKKAVKEVLKYPSGFDVEGQDRIKIEGFIHRLQEMQNDIDKQILETQKRKETLISAIKIISEFERDFQYIL